MADTTKKRGRPRKEEPQVLTDTSETLQMEKKNKDVTMEDVKNSLAGLYRKLYADGGLWSNLMDLNEYNPFLQNARLQMINAYPSSYAPDEIQKMQQDPQNSEIGLRSASASLSATQYLYYKILREACDIPLYKQVVIPPVLANQSDYLKKDFLDEEEFVEDWKNKLKIPTLLKKMGMEVKREGKPTYIFRQCIDTVDGKKKTGYVTFQKLPSSYVKLTAIGEDGFIASFNMLLFLQPAFSPKQYPEYIQNIWSQIIGNDIIREDSKGKYVDIANLQKFSYSTESGETLKGTLQVKSMARRSYMYWVQLPQDLCFTFASDMSTAWAAPDTMGLFGSLQELTDYSTLAGLVASTPLTAVLTGQAETITNTQPGQDQTEISPHTLLALQNSFDDMVSGNVQGFFAPLKDMKLQTLPNQPNSSDIKTKAIQNFISAAGEGGLIVATDKPSVAMIKGAQLLAESQYDFVTRQFENAINRVLNKWCGLKYEWHIQLWGGIYTFENQVKIMKEMVAGGATFLLPRLASAYNFSMRQIRGVSDYIEAHKIYDKFKTLGWAQTQQNAKDASEKLTVEQTGAGRKSISEEEIENDSTAASRETGANISELKEDYAAAAEKGVCPICGDPVEEGHIFCESCESDFGLDTE